MSSAPQDVRAASTARARTAAASSSVRSRRRAAAVAGPGTPRSRPPRTGSTPRPPARGAPGGGWLPRRPPDRRPANRQPANRRPAAWHRRRVGGPGVGRGGRPLQRDRQRLLAPRDPHPLGRGAADAAGRRAGAEEQQPQIRRQRREPGERDQPRDAAARELGEVGPRLEGDPAGQPVGRDGGDRQPGAQDRRVAQPAAEVRDRPGLEPVLHHRRPRRDRGLRGRQRDQPDPRRAPGRRDRAPRSPAGPARRRRSRGSPSRAAGRRRCTPPARPRPASPAPGARSAPARLRAAARAAPAAGRRWRSPRRRAAPGSTRAATAARSAARRRSAAGPAGGTGSSPAGRRRRGPPRRRTARSRPRPRSASDDGDGPPCADGPQRVEHEGRGGRRGGGHRDEDGGPGQGHPHLARARLDRVAPDEQHGQRGQPDGARRQRPEREVGRARRPRSRRRSRPASPGAARGGRRARRSASRSRRTAPRRAPTAR